MKKISKRYSYRFNVFLINLLVTIIPILFFFGAVDARYISEQREHALDSLSIQADTLMSTIDDCMDQIKTVAGTLFLQDENELNYAPVFPSEANEFRERLMLYVTDSTLFSEIALYASDNEYMFSNFSSYTKERFFKMSGLQGISAEQVDKLLEETYGPVVLPAQGSNAFCVLYPMHIRGKTKGLFFVVPATKLNAHMSTALFGNEGYCQLTDNAGQVLFSYSSDGFIPEESVVARCANGERSVREGTKTLFCAVSTSAKAEISAQLIIRDGSIHQSIDSIRWKWVILIVTSIALSFVASWVTSVINTKPVVELSRKISSNKIRERERWSNELEHIEDSIRYLNEFATTVRSQMDEVGEYLMYRLLSGTIESVDDANQLSQILGTSIYANAYQVCIVHTGDNSTVNEVGYKIQELLPPEVSNLVCTFDSVFICVFFCSLDDQNTMDVISEAFLRCYPKGKLAFGNSYSRLEEIPISFIEAFLAAENADSSVTSYTYPVIVTKTVEDFSAVMESNEISRILESMERIYRNTVTGNYTVPEGKCISVRVSHILSESILSEKLADVLPNTHIVISAETLEVLSKQLEMVIQRLHSIHDEHTELAPDPPLVEQMVSYLKANYLNANFSLQQMAFDFRLTPAMLSRYFKENYGQNINDYLNNLKMERARKLLLETNLPVYEVGLELGYQGPNSFIRRFKATYGITPGEFRQETLRDI